MRSRLLHILGAEHKVDAWLRLPIKEWHNFTVNDMKERGLYTKVCSWFNILSDKQIKEIYDDSYSTKGCRKSPYQLVDELGY